MPPYHHHPCNKVLLLPLLIVAAASVAAFITYLPRDGQEVHDISVSHPTDLASMIPQKRMLRMELDGSDPPRGGPSDSSWRGGVEYTFAINTENLPPEFRSRLLGARHGLPLTENTSAPRGANGPWQGSASSSLDQSGQHAFHNSARPHPDLLLSQYQEASSLRIPRIPSYWYSRERSELHYRMAMQHLRHAFGTFGRHTLAAFRGARAIKDTQHLLSNLASRNQASSSTSSRRIKAPSPCYVIAKGVLHGTCDAGREFGKTVYELGKSAEFHTKLGLAKSGFETKPKVSTSAIQRQQNFRISETTRQLERKRLRELAERRNRLRRPSLRQEERVERLANPRVELLDPVDDGQAESTRSRHDAPPNRSRDIRAIEPSNMSDDVESGGNDAMTTSSRGSEIVPAQFSTTQRHSTAAGDTPGPDDTARGESRTTPLSRSSTSWQSTLAGASRSASRSATQPSRPSSIRGGDSESREARDKAVKAALQRAKKQCRTAKGKGILCFGA